MDGARLGAVRPMSRKPRAPTKAAPIATMGDMALDVDDEGNITFFAAGGPGQDRWLPVGRCIAAEWIDGSMRVSAYRNDRLGRATALLTLTHVHLGRHVP